MPHLLFKDLLSFFSDYDKIHITGFGLDDIKYVKTFREDPSLDKACVRCMFASMFDRCITIELYSSIILDDEIVEECHKVFEEMDFDIEYAFNNLLNTFGNCAKEIMIRTNRSVLFIGSYDKFSVYKELFKGMIIKSIKRIHKSENDNLIEFVVEEEASPLKLRHFVKYMYPHKQVVIMDWNQDWIYCGNAEKIEGEILDRYIDKVFTTAQLPNRLVVMLKHK